MKMRLTDWALVALTIGFAVPTIKSPLKPT
jgi:hypothetical protein